MPVVWRDAMNVGHPIVDDDHRHLVDLLNQCEVALGPPVNHRAVARILMALHVYTVEHFAREERLQLDIKFNYARAHKLAHNDLLATLAGMMEKYGTEAEPTQRDALANGAAEFLRNWLVEHIIGADLHMRPYIEKYLAAQESLDRQG